jgi:hypothetical protein
MEASQGTPHGPINRILKDPGSQWINIKKSRGIYGGGLRGQSLGIYELKIIFIRFAQLAAYEDGLPHGERFVNM